MAILDYITHVTTPAVDKLFTQKQRGGEFETMLANSWRRGVQRCRGDQAIPRRPMNCGIRLSTSRHSKNGRIYTTYKSKQMGDTIVGVQFGIANPEDIRKRSPSSRSPPTRPTRATNRFRMACLIRASVSSRMARSVPPASRPISSVPDTLGTSAFPVRCISTSSSTPPRSCATSSA
jgi:hypothetical protein